MKKIVFILTLLLWAQNSFAEGECAAYRTMPALKFSTSYGKLTYDKSKDYDELTEVGKKYGIVEQGLFASGLALVDVAYKVTVDAYRQRVKRGVYCVIPAQVNVFIGYQNPVILIAKDMDENSCEYNVVLRHEQTHQQINVATLRYFLPKLKEAVTTILKNTPPVEISTTSKTEEATQELTDNYIKQITPLIDFLKKEVLKEQSTLDDHTNYQLEGDLCRYYNSHH